MTDDPTTIGFGDAFARLQEITRTLGADEPLPPDRMVALLREGAGLERALREHLDRVEQEVRSIEAGEGALAFRIDDGAPRAPADPPASSAAPVPTGEDGPPPDDWEPASDPADDWQPLPPSEAPSRPAPPPPTDDELPF